MDWSSHIGYAYLSLNRIKTMKYPLPFSLPKGCIPVISQLYGNKTYVDWYKANGVNIDAHNGIDFVVGNPIHDKILTYGAKLVCPVPNAEFSYKWFTDPMCTQGNGIQIGWEEGNDRYLLIFWHCSEIVVQNTYKEQDVVGYIGNSGLVSPKPTYTEPFNGAHLHLGLRKNNVLIDPLEIFDLSRWYTSEDSGQQKDLPPLFWSLAYAKQQVNKLLALLGLK